MGRNTFERLRVWIIHKLNGVTQLEANLPPQKTLQIKQHTAMPQMISAKMVLREGEYYAPALVQQRLSYQLADALVDNGLINFYTGVRPDEMGRNIIRADLWVIKKEENHAAEAEEYQEGRTYKGF